MHFHELRFFGLRPVQKPFCGLFFHRLQFFHGQAAQLRFTERFVLASANCLGVNFSETDALMFSVKFEQCVLDFASFLGKKMPNTPFLHTSLKQAVFIQTDLSGAKFEYANLEGAVF